MDLKDILTISGQPGLYKFVAQSSNGIIVESLADCKRSNVSASSRVSSIGEIAIYTDSDDMPIEKVFQSIYRDTDGKETISHKSSADELKSYFEKILPEYDRDQVHVSDMKKVLSWYNILNSKGMIDLIEKEEEEVAEENK
ncbi:MAG: DUF5606 domain-containing protein [Rikenellaceae bacterium]|nr:DUF5606 domain-containing protein [Rikenellaceae bacterium]